jgi:glycerol-3-phosphate O-acyltransferase
VTDHQYEDVSQAVLHREEIARILREGHGVDPAEAQARVHEYLAELRTTQRYHLYRALQHPLYPIFRKITRIVEHPEIPRKAVKGGRVVYVSNHKSHTDYLVELLVLDDLGVRPPLIAAGVNLFGGLLGLVQRHVTGAIPIRRATKDPIYLITLKAYVAEVLKQHDLFFYPEGGRSYSGELKPLKTGLLHASLTAGVEGLAMVPAAVAYDLVLEDMSLAKQGVKRRQRPFTREMAEMIRLAVGYKTRAFVTFGEPIALDRYHGESRRDVLELAHLARETVGRLYKVLPTALVSAAMHPSLTVPALEGHVDRLLDHLRATGANLAVRDAKEAVDQGCAALVRRGILRREGSRLRVRERSVLKYYARTIRHLLPASSSSDRI